MRPGPIEFPVDGLVDGPIRVRLRADSDTAAMVEACQDPEIQRFTTVPDRYGEINAREFARQSAIALAGGTALNLAIADSASDELLGSVGLRRHQIDLERWSAGYWVARWARGRGVATAALRLICRFGFDELGATRIELCAEPENAASLAVAERVGFAREGLLRSYELVKGRRRDMLMYSLLPDDLV